MLKQHRNGGKGGMPLEMQFGNKFDNSVMGHPNYNSYNVLW